jgi:murein L,D-transpeptidase YcbB/YkuD
MREDILPKAFDNKEYLTEHNFEVLPSWLSNSVIPFESIKWEEMTAENFPYKLRQKPGGTNALGKYKFNTPNKNSIYLHDTPLRSLFKKQHRAYSSGCIRVEKASEFAQLLMEESDYTATDYENYNQLPKTNSVGLGQKIAVYTTYQTTWIDDKDIIQFRDDIYKYDEWSKSKID